ncbi:hypothetical protein SFRURICE_003507 [Spodoptera frugiperda]|nr:hypothetical protein SFRURICE_003507 [Spodoptera frugiperda]
MERDSVRARDRRQQAVAQARTARHLLRPVLDSSLPLRAKLGIYEAYIRTWLTYAAPAWYALVSETNKKHLRAQQSLTLRSNIERRRRRERRRLRAVPEH